MHALVAEWLAKAQADLHTATRELRVRRAPNYDAVCYHSQQCAEKLLKAFLVLNNVEPPYAHNLVEPLRLCHVRDASFEMIRLDLEAPNGYGVVIRYPGTTATKQDAADAVKCAQNVRNFVAAKF